MQFKVGCTEGSDTADVLSRKCRCKNVAGYVLVSVQGEVKPKTVY